ncbi:MAG: DDE-type integrase/transposase/recombinase [Patescibacteria group bacterium]
MAYTTNPKLPRLRAQAVHMVVRNGKSVSEVARYFGYSKGAVSKWCKKMPLGGSWIIPTKSSRPHHHPKELKPEVVKAIIDTKLKYHRCSEAIHGYLLQAGIKVSLNSIKRKLDYAGLIKKRSPWKRLHLPVERPKPLQPGDLVQVDTIHLMETTNQRIYVYTLIDVHSRWTYAWATARINTRLSIKFLAMAQAQAPFEFRCLQSDHGSEFSQHFSDRIKILHRHSRVRRPNDNAHLERFNRTLQEECLRQLPTSVKLFKRALLIYLHYYNTERLHLGLNLKTPTEIINQRFQAIG